MFAAITSKVLNPAKSATRSSSLDFEEVVVKYGKKVFNVAYRMVGDRHEAEDLMQEAFFRAYKSLSSLKEEELVDRWLYRIVSNVTLDYLRRKPKRTHLSLNEPIATDSGEVNPEIADWSGNPEAKIEAHQFEGNIQMALNELPTEFRLSLILCDVEGLSYEEISRTLGCSIGTVRSRIHRARKAVREKLASRSDVYAQRAAAGGKGVSA